MFIKLRTVIFRITYLRKAKNWPLNITGMQPYFDEPFYAGFNVNGLELGFDPDIENVKPGNNSSAYLAVDNIEKAVDKCIAGGAFLETPVQNVGDTTYMAVIKDRFSNSTGLITRP